MIVRILRADNEDLDGEINETEYQRLTVEGLILCCPDCSEMFTKTLQPGATGAVYHPKVDPAESWETVEAKMIEVLDASVH